MPLYLGVDGGGSKTTAAIASDDHVLATATRGGSNAVRLPEATVRASLHGAIVEACSKAGVQPDAIACACIGAAGAAQPQVRDKIRAVVAEMVRAPIEVTGDMLVAHAGVFFGAPGVVVIAGTGSIAFARNERGEVGRAGGWGSAISDEGSGHWIGRRGVSAVMRCSDSGEETSLTARILRAWRIERYEEMSRIAHSVPAPDFAALFPLVQAASLEGDAIASRILADAGRELATLAKVVMSRMWPERRSAEVAMVGSIFRHSPIVRQVFYDSVHSTREAVKVRFCTMDPVYGAVYLARKMANNGASGSAA